MIALLVVAVRSVSTKIPRRYTLRVLTLAFSGHRTVLSGKETQCLIGGLKSSNEKISEIRFNTRFMVVFRKL